MSQLFSRMSPGTTVVRVLSNYSTPLQTVPLSLHILWSDFTVTHITSVSVLRDKVKKVTVLTLSNTHELNCASNMMFPVEIKHIKDSTSMGLKPSFWRYSITLCYASKRLFVGIRTHLFTHYKYNVVTCFWLPPNVVWVIGSQNILEHVYTCCPLKINRTFRKSPVSLTFSIFVGVLEGLHQSQRLVHRAAHRQVIDGNLPQDAFIINHKQTSVGARQEKENSLFVRQLARFTIKSVWLLLN